MCKFTYLKYSSPQELLHSGYIEEWTAFNLRLIPYLQITTLIILVISSDECFFASSTLEIPILFNFVFSNTVSFQL